MQIIWIFQNNERIYKKGYILIKDINCWRSKIKNKNHQVYMSSINILQK